jgi:uncharacterized protein (DUF885 family)
MTIAITISLSLLVFVFLWFLISSIWGKPWSINLLYNRFLLELLLDNPEILTMIGILERMGIRRHNAKFSDSSEAHEIKTYKKYKHDLRILRSYNRSRQNDTQLTSTDILDWGLDDLVRGEKFRHHDYPLNQMFGVQSQLPDLLMNLQPLKTKQDARNYIKRLNKFDVKFDQILEGLHIREEKKCIPPNFTVKHVINEMQAFIDQPATENPLYTVFKQKISDTKIKEPTIEKFLSKVEEEIKSTVYPTYQRLIDYFSKLEKKATGNHGVWNLPGGDEYYAHCLRSNTTTELSPDEIHEIGLREVSRIEGQMAAILESLGLESEKPTQQLLAFGKDDRFLYPNTDEGREACLADYTQMLDEIDQAIKPVFDLRPKAGLEVKRVPEFKEKTSPAAYYHPPDLSGDRPGMFFVNLRDMKDIPKFGMKTLAFHEGIPGHHFQIAIAQTLKSVPFFRRMLPFTAYVEGWAMYAENLASELGMYQDDPYGELGYLDSILFRAVRLVVDTGIHHKHWTREQAIEYLEAHSGLPHKEVVIEIERYFVMPGQACSYKVGELKILELREKAKQALGEKFDLRQFHNVVLGKGAMPLTLLEKMVDEYIEEAKGK